MPRPVALGTRLALAAPTGAGEQVIHRDVAASPAGDGGRFLGGYSDRGVGAAIGRDEWLDARARAKPVRRYRDIRSLQGREETQIEVLICN